MKVFAYSVRPEDEAPLFKSIGPELGLEVRLTDQPAAADTAQLAKGAGGISIIATPMKADLIKRFRDLGVQIISTRSIGFDHIDLKAAQELGMRVSHASYSPGSVADYTVMLMLAGLRRLKAILHRGDIEDYTLDGLCGRELGASVVGVVGTGHIGAAVAARLTGFGCRILAFDGRQSPEVAKVADYVDLPELLKQSDVVTLHVPANDGTRHLIDAQALAGMKNGALLVNAARGSIVDSAALIKALESGHLGGACLDTLEGESPVFHHDLRGAISGLHELSILKDMPNVIVTHHVAFYTETAVRDMVTSSLKSCLLNFQGQPNPWEVKASA